jgi:mRNA export factor
MRCVIQSSFSLIVVSQDGTKVLSGGADNAARMYDVQTGQPQQVAQHDAPIKVVKWVETPQGGILATGSWDKTIKVRHLHVDGWLAHAGHQYWDLRQSNPVSTVQLPERCYTMDVAYPLLVVGCAERHIQIYNLTNPTTVYKVRQSFSILNPYTKPHS